MDAQTVLLIASKASSLALVPATVFLYRIQAGLLKFKAEIYRDYMPRNEIERRFGVTTADRLEADAVKDRDIRNANARRALGIYGASGDDRLASSRK